MTVLSTDLAFEQYTGNGTQTYFEYGFDLTAGTQVHVTVDGVPATFEYQANGVVISPAPPQDAVVLVMRETDITQLRDFKAFDSFNAAWTEDACDKLILLKQEAVLWRAKCNLYADHKLSEVEIANDKGNNANIVLWNEGFSGMFAGLVSMDIPYAGTFVEKPEDFEYFQYGDYSGPPDAPTNYERFTLLSDNGSRTKLYDYNFATDEYRLIGGVITGGVHSNLNDGKNTFLCDGIGTQGMLEHIWRGHVWSYVDTVLLPSGGATIPNDSGIFISNNRFVYSAVSSLGHGVGIVEYDPDNLGQAYTNYQQITASNDSWVRVFDVQDGNIGDYATGDAFIVTPASGSDTFATFKWDSGTELYAIEDSISNPGNMANPLHNRFSRYISGYSGSFVNHLKIESDLSITDGITATPTASAPQAAIVDNSGNYVLTVEAVLTGDNNDLLRTYEIDGDGTVIDELDMLGDLSGRETFVVSPYSGRIWLFTASAEIGLRAFSIDSSTGAITQEAHVEDETAHTGGGFVTNGIMCFYYPEMEITSNGFTGIKEKLFECWEFEDDLVGAMGNVTLVDAAGTTSSPTYVTQGVGKAAYLDGGAAVATASVTPPELQALGNYSFCLDVTFDAIGTEQHIFTRARENAANTTAHNWDCGLYINAAGNFIFWVNTDSSSASYNPHTIQAGTLVAVAATKYHIYVEFDRENDSFSIKVNGGTLYTGTISNTDSHNLNTVSARFTFGQRTTFGAAYQRMTGTINQAFAFYDVLTTAEQDFMYNSGNSRAFSEL